MLRVVNVHIPVEAVIKPANVDAYRCFGVSDPVGAATKPANVDGHI